MKPTPTPTLLLIAIGLTLQCALMAQNISKQSQPENVIRSIYQEVSRPNKSDVDWEYIRSLFTDDAIVILRSSPDSITQFTADGYIEDFRSFYRQSVIVKKGFIEEIKFLDAKVYQDMAFIGVLYESSVPGIPVSSHRGIDFWLLRKIGNAWKVFAISNEVLLPGVDIPEKFNWKIDPEN